MSETKLSPNQRLTRKQKNAGDKQWFKEKVDSLDRITSSGKGTFGLVGNNGISEYKRMKVNYDLFNNIIDRTDFEHVCYPFGKEVGELPVDFTNKDILSGKIKALLGMEMRRPFSWKVFAVNEEATTRREQEQFGMLKEFVVSSIMTPIQMQLEQEAAEQSKGEELTPEEQEQIQQQVQEQLKAMTPPEVKKYMARYHQDPAEAMSHQILEYLIEKEDIEIKFNKAWKHGLIAGKEIFWIGAVNGHPTVKVINPLKFDYDRSADLDFIEEGEWAYYEMNMSPTEVVRHFGSELSLIDIDEIYEDYVTAESMPDDSFTFRDDGMSAIQGVRVVHCEWKALKPFKFLRGVDLETGEEYEDIVDEAYKINREAGDISVTVEWIPTKYEGYKIGKDKYAYLREVPGQNRDLDNLYNCRLSYVGAAFDDLNSQSTSLVDRMKYYQYMYNILMYRIELLIASDEGQSLLLNSSLIPKSAGLDIEKWMYYFKVNKLGLLDPTQEGNKGNPDMSQAAKVIDMSLISDIQKYIQLAEYTEQRCGESVGITKTVEGQIGSEEAVRNTQQALVQSANILEPYFELHNTIKRNVLQALIECAKVTYSEFRPESLSYILDDMSLQMLVIDYDLLENSTYGLFVSNSMKTAEALQKVEQLSHAAMQNQKIELSDVIKVMRSESIQEAEELLQIAETERMEREQQQAQSQQEAAADAEEKAKEFRREEWAHDIAFMERQEELKTERELQKQTILSLGFNEDKDLDRDGVPDVLEVYKAGVDAEIKQSKIDLEKDKLAQKKKEHKDKVELENKKIKAQAAKNSISNK